jgi:RNA-binding protein Musashi
MADTSYYGHGGGGGGGGGANDDYNGGTPPNSGDKPAAAAAAKQLEGRLFVGGLSWQTTEESLRWHFEQYGQVTTVELMKDRNTGKPRGFGFVCFTDPATVEIVMQESTHEVNHKVIDVKRAQARGMAPPSIHQDRPPPPSSSSLEQQQQQPVAMEAATTKPQAIGSTNFEHNKVFVGGIPHSIDRDGLRDIFSEFGKVTEVVIMLDQLTQRSRGFAFVSFEDNDGADKAIEAQPLSIQGRHVEVKLATPRGGVEQKSRAAAAPPPASKHLGLRAGLSSSSGEFAGLAVAFGRSGWKAGYGSKAFGAAGWAVQGWDDGGSAPERSGFSFGMLEKKAYRPLGEDTPPLKRSKH